ncbi:MAG: GDP-mannose 4,6-dehydratase [Planctomycetota bacterium]|nr:GDP-mannose 4,6-dehydratase [Planctomycetota bacterium]
MGKSALITGITGQDGSYLAEFLLARGYRVHGLVRRRSPATLARIAHLVEGPERSSDLLLHDGDLGDPLALRAIAERADPDEVYHLAAQSHVGLSFTQPETTIQTTGLGAVRMLEAVRGHRDRSRREVRYYQAGSSEMFGGSPAPQSEVTPFRPRSPYGCAKVLAHQATLIAREAYGLFACNGILFNHESPRRGEEFVTRKVARAAARIRVDPAERLALGNLEARRDWGYAPDFVEAMWRMLQQDAPGDWVVATGVTHSVRDLLEVAFGHVGLDWRDHVDVDRALLRPLDVDDLCGDATRARRELGWRPRQRFEDMIVEMTEREVERAAIDDATHGSRREI